jgi:putative DNA primase/helicase
MAPVLKLVPASPQLALPTTSEAIKPKTILTIVKALELDRIRVPTKGKPNRTRAKADVQSNVIAGGDTPDIGRNNTLTSLAGSMRRKGMSEGAIEAALQAENLARFALPMDAAEVSTIAGSIMRYPAASNDEVLKSLTDTGNAARFGEKYSGQVRYVFGMGWVIWDGLRWQRDEMARIMEHAKKLVHDIYSEGEGLQDDGARVAIAKHAKASQQAPRLKAMLDLAQSLPELATAANLLDSHDMLLGVANGVVNLKTGKWQLAHVDDLLTQHSPVPFDASAKCPQFLTFIQQITGGDKSLMAYLQKVVGYCLTGRTVEQCLFFLYGNGANGKSTFCTVVKELVGPDLAKQTPTETLMIKRSGATNDIARLRGVRVVIANEIEDGSQLAEALIKQMTGGEALTARFHYQEFFELDPKFKLLIAGNHKPMIRGRDNGIWRRIRLIPFDFTVPAAQRDKNLQVKLRAELPGILNWAIEGCLAWQKSGLVTPKVISDAVTNYRGEMDVIGQWLSDCCSAAANHESKAGEVYQSYKLWAERNGYKPMAAGTFSRDLQDDFKKVKRNDGNYYQGIKCRQ